MLACADLSPTNLELIDEGHAADIHFACELTEEQGQMLEGASWDHEFDVVIQSAADRNKRLLIADMDKTVITVECLDELADYAGIREEIVRITDAAMRGEIDFADALKSRVILLKDLPIETLEQCYQERIRLTPGARTLIHTLRRNGVLCILISGGFAFFASRVSKKAGFNSFYANNLEYKDARLTGEVLGNIIGAEEKYDHLNSEASALGIPLSATIAIGDGANDCSMISAAGLGVSYHGKPKLEAIAGMRIRHNDLTAVLYALGYTRKDWDFESWNADEAV